MAPTLIVLNGPPASGKSTLARLLVERRPLALCLDIDDVRSMLGASLDDPDAAGVAARRLALAMTDTHLAAGFDVVVPQLLMRSALLDELELVARRHAAEFVEVLLQIGRDEAIHAFEQRRASPESVAHRHSIELIDRMAGLDPIGEMYDAVQRLADRRPGCHRLAARRGAIDATLDELVDLVERAAR